MKVYEVVYKVEGFGKKDIQAKDRDEAYSIFSKIPTSELFNSAPVDRVNALCITEKSKEKIRSERNK